MQFLTGHSSSVYSVSWSPDGAKLASGSGDKTVRLWDASTGAPIGSPLKVDGEVKSVVWSPCGNKLSAACNNFSGSGSYSVKIFSKEGSTGNLVCQSTLNVGYAPFSRDVGAIFNQISQI